MEVGGEGEKTGKRGIGEGSSGTNLATIFLPPGKYTPLAVPAHDLLDVASLHSMRFRTVRNAVAIFEVDTMLMQQMKPLLLVV